MRGFKRSKSTKGSAQRHGYKIKFEIQDEDERIECTFFENDMDTGLAAHYTRHETYQCLDDMKAFLAYGNITDRSFYIRDAER